MAIALAPVATLGGDVNSALAGMVDMLVVPLDGVTLMLTTTPPGGAGLVLWRLDPGGVPVELDRMPLPGTAVAGLLPRLTLVDTDAGPVAMVGGIGGGAGMLAVPVGSGGLGAAFLPAADDSLVGVGPVAVAPGGWLCGSAGDAEGPLVWRIGADGRLTAAGEGPAPADGRPGVLAAAEVGGRSFLLAGGDGDTTLTCYEIDGAGVLQIRDSVAAVDGPGIALPRAIEVIRLGGQTLALVAGAGSDTLSVYRLGADGTLVLTDHLTDSLLTRFDAARFVASAVLDGAGWVVAGGADDGISLFRLLSDGRLVHAATLADRDDIAPAWLDGLEIEPDPDPAPPPPPPPPPAGGLLLEGGAGDDLLVGTGWTDRLFGNGGADEIHGLTGADLLDGGDGDDLLIGLGGQDEIHGGAGADSIQGNGGNDTLYGGAGDDTINGGIGWDMVLGGAGSDDIRGMDGYDELHGGGDGDVLSGNFGNDRLYGEDGDDVLTGGQGVDWLYGGSGADRLSGDSGPDLLWGDDDDDLLSGNAGNDELDGGAGDDLLRGGIGNDLLLGGDGNDDLRGDNGADRLDGGAGDDRLTGGGGTDRFVFTAGHDRIVDFTDDVDLLLLDPALWGGGLSVAEMVGRHARPTADGGTVFDWGDAGQLTLDAVAPGALLDDIAWI